MTTRLRTSFVASLLLIFEARGTDFVCHNGWHEEAHSGARLCRKSDGSNNWLCPLGWSTIRDLPRCVPGIQGSVVPVASEAPHLHNKLSNTSMPKALELRDRMAKCGLIRWSYGCKGSDYDAWWNEDNYASLLQSEHAISAAISSNSVRKDILFLGNSHLSQLGVATMCAFSSYIEEFWGTDMKSGCLREFGHHASSRMECFGNSTCGMYLARARLKSGARILLANNHPWLFQGNSGLDAALRHLLHTSIEDTSATFVPMVNLSSVGAVVLGNWNQASWAELIFRPSDEERLKRAHLGKPPGSAPGDGICGNTKNSKPLQAWDTQEVLHFLSKRGFKGNIVLAGMQIPPYEIRLEESILKAHPNMQFLSLKKLR
jgi:hypothetical protein